MSDDALIRRGALKAAMKARGWEIADLPEALGFGRYTYWRDVLGGDKSFGEKVARKIEEKLGLERGHLDRPAESAALSPDSDTMRQMAQLLQDIASTPEAQRQHAIIAAIRAVAGVTSGTTEALHRMSAEKSGPKPKKERQPRRETEPK